MGLSRWTSKFDNADGIFFGLELDSYRDYINFNENNIDRETNILNERFDELEKSFGTNSSRYDEEFLEHIRDNHIDEFKKFDDDFRQNLRRSQIIMLYSFLEQKLKVGCNSYARGHQQKYFVNDLKGQNDLDKIKVFIKKSMRIEINELNPEWSFLDNVRKVRNNIVHHNCIVKKQDNSLASCRGY